MDHTIKQARFTAEMTMAEAYNAHPQAREVFAFFHIGGCSHCQVDDAKSLKQVAEDFGIPLNLLLNTLNTLS